MSIKEKIPAEQQRQPPDIRAAMSSNQSPALSASLGYPLISIDKSNLDATARNPSVAHMATLRVFAVQNSKDRLKSVSALMQSWESAYQSISIGYKGKAREEYGKFANLAAAGGGPLASNDAIMQPLLNEGVRTPQKGKHFWNRNKGQQ